MTHADVSRVTSSKLESPLVSEIRKESGKVIKGVTRKDATSKKSIASSKKANVGVKESSGVMVPTLHDIMDTLESLKVGKLGTCLPLTKTNDEK